MALRRRNSGYRDNLSSSPQHYRLSNPSDTITLNSVTTGANIAQLLIVQRGTKNKMIEQIKASETTIAKSATLRWQHPELAPLCALFTVRMSAKALNTVVRNLVAFTLHISFAEKLTQDLFSCKIQDTSALKCTYNCWSATVRTTAIVQTSKKISKLLFPWFKTACDQKWS